MANRTPSTVLVAVVLGTASFALGEDRPLLDFRHVQPQNESADRKYEYREFVMKPGDTFKSLRGGVFRVDRIAADEIVVSRPKRPSEQPKGFRIDRNAGIVPVGNHERIEVVACDEKNVTVTIRLLTQTKMNLMEKLAF